MVSTPTSARLEHLEAASRCLLVSSPAISAYLQSELNATSNERDEVVSKRSNRSCSACGNILVLGWSCERVGSARKIEIEGKVEYRLRCSKCNAIMAFKAERFQQRNKGKKSECDTLDLHKSKTRSATIIVSQPEAKDIKTSNRRSRSKKTTLQSMLADQKKTEVARPKGFGLDLMDLMQR